MGRLIVGIICGVVVGYVLAQLFAPRDGAEPMAALSGQADGLRERPRHLADATQERIRLAVEEGRRAADVARAELEAKALERDAPNDMPTEPTGESPL